MTQYWATPHNIGYCAAVTLRIILKRVYNMLPTKPSLNNVRAVGFVQDFYVGSVTEFLDFCEPNIFALIYVILYPM